MSVIYLLSFLFLYFSYNYLFFFTSIYFLSCGLVVARFPAFLELTEMPGC